MGVVFDDNTKRIIGERIRKLRENYPDGKLSRQDLCDKINDQNADNEDESAEPTHKQREITEPMLKQWELGLNAVPIEWIPVLCKVFKADTGYFFGEYECKTRQATDIQVSTGLSEKAVNTLEFMNTMGMGEDLEIISSLITNPLFISAVQQSARSLAITQKCAERDAELKKVKDMMQSDDYYTLHALTDEMIQSQTGTHSIELSASDVGTLYKLAALDDLQSALKDVMKGLSKNGTNC